jgi:ADP-heptose:LPS heptosyltransferase
LTHHAIRLLDRHLGRPLCALLTVHRRLFDTRAARAAARAPSNRILFVKLIEQGATVLAYDAIRRATDLVGRENVFFCVLVDNRPILDVMDMVPQENVLVIRDSGWLAFARDVWRAIGRARRARIDTTIDMEFLSRASAILTYLTGARRRVGLHRFREEGPYRGDLMTHRLAYNPFAHTARAYGLLVDALAADPDDVPLPKIDAGALPAPAPPFKPSAAETARVGALLEEVAGRPVRRPVIVLNPNASDMLPLRRWPSNHFAELGRRILADYPSAHVVVTGAAVERAAAADLCRAIDSPRVVNLAGRTTLRDVLILYTIADVLVTNDSGPGHFASLTGIDSIVLFGPGAPSQFGPIGERSHVLWAGLACSPCVNVYNHRFSACANNVCMQAIGVDQVFERVRACLSARSHDGAQEPRRLSLVTHGST